MGDKCGIEKEGGWFWNELFKSLKWGRWVMRGVAVSEQNNEWEHYNRIWFKAHVEWKDGLGSPEMAWTHSWRECAKWGMQVKRIYRAEVDGTRGRGRPRTRWLDGMRKVLSEKGMTIQHADRCLQDIKGGLYGRWMLSIVE